MAMDDLEPVAVIGRFKFLRLTADLWMAVQCDNTEIESWVINATNKGCVMSKIKKCGTIIPVRMLDRDEIESLLTLVPKLY